MGIIIKTYRKLPKTMRKTIYDLFLKKTLDIYRTSRFYLLSNMSYFIQPFFSQNEAIKAYAFMKKNGVTTYPGEYLLEYNNMTILLEYDERRSLYFIYHKMKKLYFPRSYSQTRILEIYKSLIVEQNEKSPHRYVNEYSQLKDKVLLDIGAAEGIFSLDTIEYAKRIYLFECDDDWIEALKATFDPWMGKVEIIKKYVGDKNDSEHVTIDTFLADLPSDNIFIKMDIEGAELSALNGAKETFSKKRDLKFSICTYHNKEDKRLISSFLSDHGYLYEFTSGYLFIFWKLRTAIIRSRY